LDKTNRPRAKKLINKKAIPLLFVLFAFFMFSMQTVPASAVSPSNSGLAGLWEYPTAEMPGDGKGFISYSDFYPYRAGSASLGIFPWLEFNLRLTEFENSKIISPGYGHYKDKAMDLKFLLTNQRDIIPAIAVGTLDMMGTEIRKAYFAAGTWKWNNMALTLGYATDAYNGFYGGISWEPYEWLEIKAEYSPLDYTQDSVDGIKIHPDPAKEKYNFGAVLKSPWGLNGSLSYQRGEEFCFGINYAFDLTKPIFGGKNPPTAPDPVSTDWAKTDIKEMAVSLQDSLGQKGFGLRNIIVLTGDKKIHIAFENIGFSSQAEGTARAIILAAHKIPWDTETCSFAPMVRGNPVSRIELNTEQLALIRMHKFNAYDIPKNAVVWAPKTKYGTLPDETWETMAGPGKTIKNGAAEIRVALAYEPRIDKTLQNDYMSRLDIDYIGRLRSSDGWEAFLQIRQPLYNDIDIWWEPEINDKTRIWKGVLSYVYKMDKNLWGLGEIGWLDENYFGGNFWGRYYINNSPFWVGGRVSITKERDFNSFAGLPEYRRDYYNGKAYYLPINGDNDWTGSYWAEAGYHDSTYNADIIARYGKFVDSDKGYRIDATRNWNDTTVGFYFTDTDRDTPGKNYTDAGMILHLPLSVCYAGHPSDTYWDQEFTLLSTFRLFAGVMPGAWMTPEKLIGELSPNRLNQELGSVLGHLMSELNETSQPEQESGAVYGLFEYATGEWRKNAALEEDN